MGSSVAIPDELQKSRILVIDDDAGVRFALKKFLSDPGFAVETAATGNAAIAMLAQGSWHVVLSDLHLPDIDGFALVERIRAFDAKVPLLVITAHSSADIIKKAFEKGANGFISKPFRDTAEIQQKVVDALVQFRSRL